MTAVSASIDSGEFNFDLDVSEIIEQVQKDIEDTVGAVIESRMSDITWSINHPNAPGTCDTCSNFYEAIENRILDKLGIDYDQGVGETTTEDHSI